MTLRAFLKTVVPLGFALLLSACGGGGVPPSGNDLVVTGSGPSAPLAAGQTASFNLSVKNNGPVEAKDLVLSASARGLNQAQLSYACTAAGNAVCPPTLGSSMFAATLPVNGSLSFTISGPVGENVDGVISATLRAEAAGDNDRSNNVATISGTAFTLQSDVVVTGTGPAAPVAGGGIATFVMKVTNNGPQPTTDVLIENRPGASSSLNNIACAASGGATCPTSLNPTMLASAMPVNSALTFTVQTNVAKGYNGYNGALNNTLSVTLAKDPDKTNNLFTATGVADSASLSGSDIMITGLGPEAPVAAGGIATFAMEVVNNGPQASKTVQLVNSVGAGGILSGITCQAFGGAACPAAVGPSMQVPTIPIGGILQFSVSANIAAGAGGGTVKNTMTAILGDDPDKTNNLSTATAATFGADLQVRGTPPSGNVKAGSIAAFTMTVTNLGPDAAQDVAITNTVDENLTLSHITCVASGGAICPASLGAEMSAALIPSGGALVFTVQDTVTAGFAGRIANTMAVVAAGDAKPGNNSATSAGQSTTANLGVSQTVAERVPAGRTVFFTATVANAGPNLAQNLTLVHTLPSGYAAGAISCTASALAACPAVTGPTMTVPSLPVGGKLAFTIPVSLPTTARGNIDALWSVTAEGDADTSNNSSVATVIAEDPRNGGYKVFAANGRQYGLTLNFDTGAYSMAGHGLTINGIFTPDATGGGFTIAGNQHFRQAEDMIIGGFDFGEGVRPIVAARRFVASATELAGAYNLSALTLPSGGTASSRVLTAQFSSGGMQQCIDSSQIYSIATCPAASLYSYSLSVASNVFTAVDTVHGDLQSFYVAKSGGSLVYLSAGDAGGGGSGSFRIGLPDLASNFTGSFFGASTLGSWDSVLLTPALYSVSGRNAANAEFSDNAPLNLLTTGPTGIRTGLRASDQARLYVMQSGFLAIVTGARNGLANGVLEISAP